MRLFNSQYNTASFIYNIRPKKNYSYKNNSNNLLLIFSSVLLILFTSLIDKIEATEENVNLGEFFIELNDNYTLQEFFTKYYQDNNDNLLLHDVISKSEKFNGIDLPNDNELQLISLNDDYDELSSDDNSKLNSPGMKIIYGRYPIDTLKQFYYDVNIKSVTLNRNLDLAEYIHQPNAPNHLNAITGSNNNEFVYDSMAGIGVDVYILDNGIELGYIVDDSLFTRVHKMLDYTQTTASAGNNNHGTFIANLVGSEFLGIAKKANIYDCKIVDDGNTNIFKLFYSLKAIVKQAKITKRPSIIVIPLITKRSSLINNFVSEIIHKYDIPIVVPAGNDGKDSCLFSPAGAYGTLNVGSITTNTDKSASVFEISKFSNYGNCVDLYTFGERILVSHTSSSNKSNDIVKSGTSLTSGIAAGLLAYHMSRGLSSKEAIDIMLKDSLSVQQPGVAFGNGNDIIKVIKLGN
ncbi:uncharacterized protein SCODWIG_01845 [Saccharomycodes ludwigii]|uniref:Peptidase S8/S53 domain-containing protein n=1 Tax=Saccharomycodes ludwigii TaxID=36035 RepID=A0A376B6I6_9ASCO|nr:hypothetical protein SCDLUD_003889 [Saccharomycodes ludwigii]KAH3899609.1 hypothetical protein SCDLUD_003889 [Saccharomycodes ludwigii]SSD60084.1 uncharacterized protein SCODWIG_01845 [Saccharomycodes ludwigii]